MKYPLFFIRTRHFRRRDSKIITPRYWRRNLPTRETYMLNSWIAAIRKFWNHAPLHRLQRVRTILWWMASRSNSHATAPCQGHIPLEVFEIPYSEGADDKRSPNNCCKDHCRRRIAAADDTIRCINNIAIPESYCNHKDALWENPM